MARRKTEADSPAFEDRFARLQEIVRVLEAGDQPLEAGLALYKEGVALAATCREQLDKARHEITILSRQGAVAYEPDAVRDEDANDMREAMDEA